MELNNCLKQFKDHFDQLIAEDTLAAEYLTLKDAGSEMVANANEYKRSVGSIAKNRCKNRYKDIIPFDSSRVILRELPSVPYSDYINANYVQGVYGSKAYIASQAPLPHTVGDFWRMIWEIQVKVVLMACNEFESNKMKCARYWPLGEHTPETFGSVTVTLKSTDERDNGEFIIRRLQVDCEGESRTVMQYHYTAWPDHGIPHSMVPILDMLSSARAYQPTDDLPIVVHCSAGCGRTGTLIAVDYVWNLLKNGMIQEEINVLNILIEMRKQRQSLIQTSEQYEVVYRAIIELLQRQISTEENHLYENVTEMERKNRRPNKSLKLNSKLAEDILSSLSGDDPTDPELQVGQSSPISTSHSTASARKGSKRVKAEYVNVEEEKLFVPGAKAGTRPQLRIETPAKPEQKAPIRAEPKTPIKADAKPPIKTDAKSPIKTDAKPPIKTDTKPPIKTDAKPPIKTDAKPSIKTDAKPPIRTDAKPPIRAEAKPLTRTEAKPPIRTEAKPPIRTEPKTPVKVDSKPDIRISGKISLGGNCLNELKLKIADPKLKPKSEISSPKLPLPSEPAPVSRPLLPPVKPKPALKPSSSTLPPASVYSLANDFTKPAVSGVPMTPPKNRFTKAKSSDILPMTSLDSPMIFRYKSTDAANPHQSNATEDISGVDDSNEYDLAGEISDPADVDDDSSVYTEIRRTNRLVVDSTNQEYSYADIPRERLPKKWSQQERVKSHTIPKDIKYYVQDEHHVSPSNGHSRLQKDADDETAYSLADDDDDDDDHPAAPPIPTRLFPSDFESDLEETYSPVGLGYPQPGAVKATRGYNTLASSSTSDTVKSPTAKIANMFGKMKIPGMSKATNVFSLPMSNGRRGSETSNHSHQEEIMYRGANMAYPNRLKPLNGERSMPLSFKR